MNDNHELPEQHEEEHHAAILQKFIEAGATVEDLARAWASMDRKDELFDAEKGVSIADVKYGHYLGYIAETEEIRRRAAKYARERKE